MFNGARVWVEEESGIQRQTQQDQRFEERELHSAFEPRSTSRFAGPLDRECPSMTRVHALSIATDRATTTKPPKPRTIRGPRAWIRHTHARSRSTTPMASAPYPYGDKPEDAPAFRTAGRGTWSQSSERVVLALASRSQPDFGGGNDGLALHVHGHFQATELSSGAHSGKRLLMIKANPTVGPGISPSSARPSSHSSSGLKGSSRHHVAPPPKGSSMRSGGSEWHATDQELYAPRSAPSSLDMDDGFGGPRDGMLADADWRHRHANRSQAWSPAGIAQHKVRLGTPVVQLTISPEELRHPIRGGPNCTVEPLFLDGRSSFSPEFQLSRQLSASYLSNDEKKRAMGPGSSMQKISDQSVPPALRHGRADPVRTVRLRSVPLAFQSRPGSQGMSRPLEYDSMQPSTSMQDRDFEMEPWRADSQAHPKAYDAQTGELNPLAPQRIPADDLDRRREHLLRSSSRGNVPDAPHR